MQPRPIAETSGPFLPRRRLPTWNMLFSLLCVEPPPRLCEIKWDRDPLVTRCLARNDRYFGTADPKRLGEQLHDRLVRGSIRRCFGYPHFQLLASIYAHPPSADPGLGRARRHADRKQVAQSIAAG